MQYIKASRRLNFSDQIIPSALLELSYPTEENISLYLSSRETGKTGANFQQEYAVRLVLKAAEKGNIA